MIQLPVLVIDTQCIRCVADVLLIVVVLSIVNNIILHNYVNTQSDIILFLALFCSWGGI
mgnify:CR=1 FL=1